MPEILIIIIYLSIYIGLIATAFYILSFLAESKRKKLLYEDDELPSVSVIIPAYNEEWSIAKTIESISSSNYPNLEIIIVDDGSKDNTFEIAKKFQNEKIKVFHREKSGGSKAAAFNFGFTKAKGEIVFSMDADTTVDPESVKRMVRFFKDKEVMATTPAMIISNPRNILQRIQHVEYLMGLFLRKAFASVNAIYITPGAFTAYRKSFLDKYGVYEEDNITEDLEMALRIQSKGYRIENCPEAPAYTVAMKSFMALTVQRRRWYFGLMKNLWNYRKVINSKYGDLGTFVIPVAIVSIFLAVLVTVYLFFKTLFSIRSDLLFLQKINFDFVNAFNLNFYVFERFLFLYFSKPVIIFVFLFIGILGFYLYYASRKLGRLPGTIINLFLFFLFFAILFGFWWIVSIFHIIFTKQVKWR